MSEILAIQPHRDNADLIIACRELGYVPEEGLVLDPTYGYGTFWKHWRPDGLVGTDIDPEKSDEGSVDFTDLPWEDAQFDCVVFDPPYKLNGTPTHEVDERYGVHGAYKSISDRHKLIADGVKEAVRVLKRDGWLLVKCQDQVASGKVWWQTDLVTKVATDAGCRKVDALLFVGGRKQPAGRRQLHARRNYSTMLIFKKET